MTPTFILVHGKWSDASVWGEVIAALADHRRTAIGVQLALDSFDRDVEAVQRAIREVEGPVIVAGWSYGGAVITTAALGMPDVQALAYIAAFAPVEGESVSDIAARRPSHALNTNIRLLDGSHTIIDREQYGWAMADGIDRRRALIAAATQKPARVGIDKVPSATPAWSSIPSSYLVAADDRALDAATQRELAARMSAAVTTIDAPHAVMLSHPFDVVAFLLSADPIEP